MATNINGIIVQDPLNDKAWAEVKKMLEQLARDQASVAKDLKNLKQRLGVR